MELNDNFISLREFKNEENKVWLILDAALKKNVSLHVLSTGSAQLKTLYSNQIQELRSYYPQKAKIMLEEILNDRYRYVEYHQLISFSDLWITKSDLNKLLPAPGNIPLLTVSNSHEVEKNTMLKLILGMAISAYGFDPREPKNSATGSNKGSIKYDLNDAGLSIDEDTIRKYLREAKEQFPHARLREKKKILVN
jgi:hypothetical protein